MKQMPIPVPSYQPSSNFPFQELIPPFQTPTIKDRAPLASNTVNPRAVIDPAKNHHVQFHLSACSHAISLGNYNFKG